MRAHRRLRFLISLCSLSLASACLPELAPRPAALGQPVFDPAVFFQGRTHGKGALAVRFGEPRTLSVEGEGKAQADGSFRLDQTVTWGDSTVEKRSWLLRKVDSTHYSATLSDAEGDVGAEVQGNLFHLRYLVRQPAVYIEQWLYLKAGGREVENRMQVTVLGMPWARMAETITRVE